PTKRGKRHLEDLNYLAEQNYDCYNLYLTTHSNADVFMPNGHTDPDYCRTFTQSKNIRFLVYSVNMPDPGSVDLASLQKVPIDFEKAAELCDDKGSYLLVFTNDKPFKKQIGALGERDFPEGYYVYVGSAMNGLESRIKRHLGKRKTTRWHLDYISPHCMKMVKTFPIRRSDSMEKPLAHGLKAICDNYVPGFGSSDTDLPSHFFYFRERPWRQKEFLNLLLDARMFKR
ncbi:MAG: DUF123 domain-containing protein, partial [bacterium]|nr:DUF123 domain-containing protein [bacterium]